MSAEPCRKAPYSSDLRWRVVWQRIGMELSFRKIADNLCLSLGTVHNHFKRFQLTGEVAPAKVSSRESTRALSEHDELTVVGLLLEDPSMYLSDVCQKIMMLTGIEVSPATICRIIHRNGFTRKKLHHVALQRSVECRGKFFAEVLFYDVHQFVWVDETGSDRKNCMRKFGHALSGESPICHRILHRGRRISAIAAMSTNGLVAYDLVQGSVNGEMFLEFIQGKLVPEMLPYDGENPQSILVMDNCSIHHVQPVLETLRLMGILVLFLPPYSPDMNPIEEMFSSIKYYLKDHDQVLQAMDDPLPLLEARFDSVTKEKCAAWIKHAGYY